MKHHKRPLSNRELLAVLIVLPVALVVIPPTVHFADALAQTSSTSEIVRYFYRFAGATFDAALYSLLFGAVLFAQGRMHHHS